MNKKELGMKHSAKNIYEYFKSSIPIVWGVELLLFFLFILMPIDFVDNPFDMEITIFIVSLNCLIGMLIIASSSGKLTFSSVSRILAGLFFVFGFPLLVAVFYLIDNWSEYKDHKILYRSKNFPETVIKIEIEENGALGPTVYRPVKETKYSWIKMKNSIDTNSIDKSRWSRVEN